MDKIVIKTPPYSVFAGVGLNQPLVGGDERVNQHIRERREVFKQNYLKNALAEKKKTATSHGIAPAATQNMLTNIQDRTFLYKKDYLRSAILIEGKNRIKVHVMKQKKLHLKNV